LPEWRPGVDYRRTYSADAKQGGGVSIDLIHEWDYLKYLFGLPTTMFNLRGRFSNLEISSDDLSVYIAEYDQMLVEVHLDYFGRKNIREIQLFTETDTIVGDILTNEISDFFDILEGKEENHNDSAGAMATLRLVEEGIV
jgi:predicted dehydrogenase